MYKKIIILVVFVLLPFLTLNAQRDYSTGLGFRSWPYWGLTVKQFVTDQTAIEVIFSTNWGGLMIDGLYEFHHNTFNTSNFNILYGFGGHVGLWDSGVTGHPWFDEGQHISIGINVIAGFEYSFDEIPFSVSLDWKPLFIVVQNTGIDLQNVSFSLRYNIK